ncbi:MAG: hypothetical protein WD512_02800, partial [Candidatus Paceibacterota bacterium]
KLGYKIVTINEGKLVTEDVDLEYQMQLYRCRFKYDCKVLPNEIKVTSYNMTYYSDKLLCGSKLFADDCPCPICWCPLINQLKTNKKGKIRIPLRISDVRYDYWVQVLAEIDAEDPDLMHLEMIFDISCHIPAQYSYTKKLSDFLVFDVKYE